MSLPPLPRPPSTLVQGATYGKTVLVVLGAFLLTASAYVLLTPAQAGNVGVVLGLWSTWFAAFGIVVGAEVGGIAYRDGKSGGLTSGNGGAILAAMEAGAVAAPVLGDEP